MGIEWTPDGDLEEVHKPNSFVRTISCYSVEEPEGGEEGGSSDSEGGGGNEPVKTPVDLEIGEHDLPEEISISVEGNTITIEGSSATLMPPPDGIFYVIGTDHYNVEKMNQVPYEADPYEWLSDSTIVKNYSIEAIIKTSEEQQENGSRVFTLPVVNNWTANAIQVKQLIKKDYIYNASSS